MIAVSDSKRYTNHRGSFYEFQLSSTRGAIKWLDTRELPSWISIFPVKAKNTFTSSKVKHKEDFVSYGIEFEKPRICACFTIRRFRRQIVFHILFMQETIILSIWIDHTIYYYYLMCFSFNKNLETSSFDFVVNRELALYTHVNVFNISSNINLII